MRISTICLALSLAGFSFAQKLEVKVLSSRPEMVSGGSALVEVSGASPDSLKIRLNGDPITPAFRPGKVEGTLVGRVEGLKPGSNLLVINNRKITLVNHPIAGPVFSGPHQQPFICQTELAGLQKAVDADCNAPTRVQYFYRSARHLTPEEAKTPAKRGELGPGYVPLDPAAELPPDVAMTTTTDGNRVKFILRVETGTINRGVYRIAFLHQPGQPLPDPWTKTPGWNGRLVYSFGGGCGTGFRQGQQPAQLDLGAVALGYAAAGSTLDVYGNNANDVINAETLMMVKEYFIKHFGVPVHTIGSGGSGGSIQQYLIAQNYPGLLDGIIPGSSFADHTSVAEPILDCALIGRVAGAMKESLTPEQRLAVAGYGSWGLCESRNHGAPQWMQAAACNPSMPRDKVYDPVKNPHGVRCSLQDNEANIYGRDPKTGAAPQIFDNVGVQYGLRAFNDGKISAEQFVELNELIGGFNADGNLGPARSSGDPRALKTAYETGRIDTGGGGLGAVPIIDFRRYGDLDGNPHDRMRSAQMRLRLERAHGSAANQVLLLNPAHGVNTVRLMDQWLDRMDTDTSAGSLQQKIARNKPEELVDACWGPNDEKITDSKRCDELYPPFQDPRLVAGEPLIGETQKCQLRPLDAKDYRQQLTEEQWARMKKAFPEGVCDYSRPGVGEMVVRRTWISFGDK